MSKSILLVMLYLFVLAGNSRVMARRPEITVNEVIARVLAVRGGAEKVRAVRSLRQTGTIEGDPGRGFTEPVPISALAKAPNKLRYEVKGFPLDFLFIFDGRQGWRASGMGPPGQKDELRFEKMGKNDTADFRAEADFNRFSPGFDLDPATSANVQLVGTLVFEGIPCHVLKMTGPDNPERFLFVERTSGQISKIAEKPDPRSNGTLLSDYREVDGVLFPFNVEIQVREKTVQQILVTRIEVNPDLDDRLFTKTEIKPKKN